MQGSRSFNKVDVNFPVFLAPMVGLSHAGLRTMVRRYVPQGAKTLWPTEMLSSRRLPREVLGTTAETLRFSNEDNLVPQILGNEEIPIRDSVKKIFEWGAVGIDINMGCPVAKALRHNYGVALMGDTDYAARVVDYAVKHSSGPVSVKLRAGKQGDLEYLEKFVGGLVNAGADWICLHPRTVEQKRRGSADWSQIKWLRDRVSVPIVGNGDIQVADDVLRMQEETGADAVMVGRALTVRPWLMWQVGEKMGLSAPAGREGERAPQTPLEEGAEFGRYMLETVQLYQSLWPEEVGLKKFGFLVRTNHAWLEFGHAFYAKVTQAKNYRELEINIRQFFSVPQKMYARTDLRN